MTVNNNFDTFANDLCNVESIWFPFDLKFNYVRYIINSYTIKLDEWPLGSIVFA